jgi:hypothetical protein
MNKIDKDKALSSLKTYQFIHEGFLDLENVCVDLSGCFNLDGKRKSPLPRDMYNLMLDLIFEHELYEENKQWVQFANLADWEPSHAHVYPDKHRTCIHISALIFVWETWIYCIGTELLSIPVDKNPMFNFWVNKKWKFVSAFINRFIETMYDFYKLADRSHLKSDGYSLFESLNRSFSKDSDLDKAQSDLRSMQTEINEVLKEVEADITEKHFQQAVTSIDSILNYRLGYFSESNGADISKDSFFKKIGVVKAASVLVEDDDLFERLDCWRKKRNQVVHERLSMNQSKPTLGRAEFDRIIEEVAHEGYNLCNELNEWCFQQTYKRIKNYFS